MDKVDILFLKVGDYACGTVRSEINFDAVLRDDFRGKDGQELFVFSAASDSALNLLLKKFEVSGAVPLIKAHDGAVVTKVKNVLMHLRRMGAIEE